MSHFIYLISNQICTRNWSNNHNLSNVVCSLNELLWILIHLKAMKLWSVYLSEVLESICNPTHNRVYMGHKFPIGLLEI